ncbi:hypothetical protein Hypma_001271 [Hypsizygus marmoreus]|uniref:Secreted protein n=1 Tax=Hypsizygus marmoreus TaxID=39966 RepID=A0A369JD77_HYPMA|nr:hypothetical protein Hypma_001271 [Hypsizygus marmoreus]
MYPTSPVITSLTILALLMHSVAPIAAQPVEHSPNAGAAKAQLVHRSRAVPCPSGRPYPMTEMACALSGRAHGFEPIMGRTTGPCRTPNRNSPVNGWCYV